MEKVKNKNAMAMSGTMASGNDFVYGDGAITTTGYTYTQLGRKYNQPLNVTNVKNAWNALSTTKISELAPTHLYIKFQPASLEELKAIEEANIPTYIFPLDYEIIQFGDFMRDPALEPNGIPPLYTLMPVDKQIPNSSYVILDSIFLLDLRSIVTQKAFELVGESAIYPGNPEEGETIPVKLLNTNTTLQDHRGAFDPNWGNIYVPIDPVIPTPPPPPDPADNVGVPTTVTNACSYSLNSDDHMPSGCIKVEKTQFYNGNVVFEGVNDVMADFIGPFFQRLSPFSNANGCFKSGRKIRYVGPFGIRFPVLFSVIFISKKKTIKAVKNGIAIEFGIPNTHIIGNVAPGGLNNCSVTYLRDYNMSHHETKHYCAALYNNALYQFDGYANADGLSKTPNNLQIIIHSFAGGNNDFSGSGATPMFNKMQMSGSAQALTIGTFLSATVGGVAAFAPNPVGTFTADVYFCYNWGSTPQDFTSDRIKEVGFHEYAHVIHYKKCGNAMWEANIQYVVANQLTGNNPPYGDLGDAGSGRCALIESWAYYLGREYNHRRYGPNRHSLSPQNFSGSWYAVNELASFEDDYMPSGFLQDLRDDNAYNIINNLYEAPGITDDCKGYTNSMFYSKLGPTTNTITGLIDKLDDNLPSGTTQTTYDYLRESYGY